MKIPTDAIERATLFQELVKQCSSTRLNRFNLYNTLRNYFLFGSQDNRGAPYNKIGSTIETLASFIYSPDSTKFSLKLGTLATQDDVHKAVPLAQEVTEQWRLSKAHLLMDLGLRWALAFGCMLMKVQWMKKHVRCYLVEPHQFGVLREDIIDLRDQEAFTHHYTITKTQLLGQLEGHPKKNEVEKSAGQGAGDNDVPGHFGDGLNRLLVGGPITGVTGSLATGTGMTVVQGGVGAGGRGPGYDWAPKVEAELIDMCDLYVWDDAIEEYRLVTQCAPGVTIYDRAASDVSHVKGEPPFGVIRAGYTLYDYFWGESFVAKLSWLQDWRTRRILEVNNILSRQADPPVLFTGMGGISEEKAATFRAAGGLFSTPNPQVKAEFLPPTMPADIFAELNQIDKWFEDQAGLGHILQGQGEAGVRSRGQADLMARLGSSRPKDRATAVEESAEAVARLILLSTQDHSEQRFQVVIQGKPLTFTAEEFTKDYEVKVDGHSSSPIFMEDIKHTAITLFEAKAIDRSTLLEMFDPPNLQELKARLVKMEAQEHAAAEAAAASGAPPPGGGKVTRLGAKHGG
ncbi:MAG: hypothetical protein HRJ53_09470 [Acidobacteria bacterium Pan2503]|uniref:Uncharacterized protein n=1 Tax=Candidatus Acidiferrum panamense TaxID=2741543 RepID=A0A7V8SWR2_9BACT|nr:hypothetical protein [Candidatus Acidoferrum panamensis]